MLTRLLTCGLCAALIVAGRANAAPTSFDIAVIARPDGSLVIEGRSYFTRSAVEAELSVLSKRTPQPTFHLVTGSLKGVSIANALAVWPDKTTPIETYIIQMRDR